MLPDTNHFHQLLYYFLKKKFLKKNIVANSLSANLINIYNGLIFLGVNLFYIPLNSLMSIVKNLDYKVIETVKRKPHDTYQVLDADSSQQESIEKIGLL